MKINLKKLLFKLFDDLIKSKNLRTEGIKKNIIGLLLTKGSNIVVNILMVPLLIKYLNPIKYGVWITLSSIIMWFSFFDIGFGNGLRNKFAEVKAIGQFDEAKKYVSTTYATLTIIFTGIWICFLLVNNFINWNQILNTPKNLNIELNKLALIIFSFLALQMVLKTINTILLADQKPAKAGLINMIGQFSVLIIVFFLGKYLNSSLVLFGLILSSVPVIVLILGSFWFFGGELKRYKPSFSSIKFSYSRNILTLGVKFFIIQIAAVIIYQTNNIIITQVSGPEDVVVYNVTLKYFMVASMIFSTIITPFWSSFTDAFSLSDYNWMNKIYIKLKYIVLLFFIFVIIMLLISKLVYKIWLGNSLQIDFNVSIFISIYVLTIIWNSLHSYILNGIGKIKLQLIFSLIGIITYIPLAIYGGQKYGIIGVVSISIFINLISAIYAPIQLKKILSGKAVGLWNA